MAISCSMAIPGPIEHQQFLKGKWYQSLPSLYRVDSAIPYSRQNMNKKMRHTPCEMLLIFLFYLLNMNITVACIECI